jgi:predicted GNAT superfamily acetyltransferase
MIKIKTLKSVEDLQKTIEIQKSAWGFSDLDMESHHLMTRVQKYGGLVQGLYLNTLCIGFTFALVAKWEGEYFIYSHMTAVKKEYQGKGYGFLLKKAQRQAVLQMGYDVIRWNFDPIESLNAFFNFHRLGVISTEYERNIYGKGESGLHQGLPTDRLIATWQLNSERVIQKMKVRESRIVENIPKKILGQFQGKVAHIEIPKDIRMLKQNDMKKAVGWRMKTRELFKQAFSKKWIARDIVFSADSQRVFCKLYREKKS